MKIFGREKQGFLTKNKKNSKKRKFLVVKNKVFGQKNLIKISVKLWETDKIIFCFFK